MQIMRSSQFERLELSQIEDSSLAEVRKLTLSDVLRMQGHIFQNLLIW